MNKTFDFELQNPRATPVELAVEPWGMIYEIGSGQTIRVSIELDEYAVSKPPSIQYGDNLISLWIEGRETFHLFRGEVEIDPDVWAPTTPASVYELPRAA